MKPQLNYVISGFSHSSVEVVQASALAFKFLGTDCRKLLAGHVPQLHQFFESVIDKLKASSQEEITEGVAAIVSVQPLDKIYDTMKMFIDPVMRRVVTLASQAANEDAEKTVADQLGLVTIFFDYVQPYVSPAAENPAVRYCQEILPALAQIAKHFTQSMPILERVCKCWRSMVISYRTATAPLLPTLASSIAGGFEASRQGCFLWATDAVIREFSDGAEFIDDATSENVFQFFASLATVFFRILAELQPGELPDVIEDFFRLAADAVRFYPKKTITSSLALPMVQASLTALTLELLEPVLAALHFLRDFLDFGFERGPVSSFNGSGGEPAPGNLPEVQAAVRQVVSSVGQELVHRVLTGMMFSFPEDCFPDASGVLLSLFNLGPQAAAQWVQETLQNLPIGSLKPAEANKLMKGIGEKLQQNEPRKVRVLLQDFTNSYRRRNVAPREGLGRLEAARFQFSG